MNFISFINRNVLVPPKDILLMHLKKDVLKLVTVEWRHDRTVNGGAPEQYIINWNSKLEQ